LKTSKLLETRTRKPLSGPLKGIQWFRPTFRHTMGFFSSLRSKYAPMGTLRNRLGALALLISHISPISTSAATRMINIVKTRGNRLMDFNSWHLHLSLSRGRSNRVIEIPTTITISMPPIIAAATWASATASQQENIGSIAGFDLRRKLFLSQRRTVFFQRQESRCTKPWLSARAIARAT
jgi:hypothetical protein